MFLLPANDPRSSSSTDRPARASTVAAHDPAGPAPTTITSKSGSATEAGLQLVEHGVGVGDDRQVGDLHHRAVRIRVDADDVARRAEPGGVLHGAADAQREVQLRVDDD